MKSYRSSPIGLALFVFGILAFNAYTGFFTSSCTCCCHPAFRPPAPAPPPPVSGLCDPNAITNSFITTCPCTCPPCPKGPARFNGLCARNVCSCCCNA
ncbi:hypothetical protein MKW92_013139 [Papaver armeniacum]|nr:hypothetical protein MKW92_013139 [Papaver armeniacum]